MNLVHQCLIKTFDDFIYFEIIYNNKFLFNIWLNKIFKKNVNNIFVFIIETNIINSIIIRFQINFKTQKYNENLIFITNIIKFKIIMKSFLNVIKYLYLIIKINDYQRFNKIVINKFV